LGASFLAANVAMLSKSLDVSVSPISAKQPLPGLAGSEEQQREVIGLFFGYINTFFPVIHPPSFYSQMGRAEADVSFMALLSVVCLCGSSFYPDRQISQRLGDMYARLALFYLRRCYLRPSLNAVQACALLALQLNPVESDPIISNSWFYSGIARSMAISLGYHMKRPSLSPASLEILRRVLWLISINDILCSHITGRLGGVGGNLLIAFPRVDLPCASVNLESCASITIPELLSIPSGHSLEFFGPCANCVPSLADLTFLINVPRCALVRSHQALASGRIFLKGLQNIALTCYSRLYPFLSGPRVYRQFLLPAENDLLLGVLTVCHLSFLIDINRPEVLRTHHLDSSHRALLTRSVRVEINEFLVLNPLEKCLMAARLAFQVICASKGRLAEFSTPIFWYAVLQICFTALLILDRSKIIPGPLSPQKTCASRRAIVHDCFLMIQPFLEKYVGVAS
ncbi:hypothetical protein L0F63_001322, partial [Massospora cicadina]